MADVETTDQESAGQPGAPSMEADTIVDPAAAGTTVVHAGFAGNDASNDFPGPFTDPDVPRNVTVTFAASWDGGDVTVVGTNQFDEAVSEVISSAPGTTAAGAKIFKTVDSATKAAVGAAADTASIGTGDKLGLSKKLSPATGVLTAGAAPSSAVNEDATWDGGNDAFTPTTVPDGSTKYWPMYPSA